MNCAEARDRLSAFHDGALDDATREAVAGHVEACSACGAYLVDVGRIGEALRFGAECQPPDGMWDRIDGAIERARTGRRVRLEVWFPRAVATAAGIVLYLLGFGLLTQGTSGWHGGGEAAKAETVEQVLHEAGDALAGVWPSSIEHAIRFDHRPEMRFVGALSEGLNP